MSEAGADKELVILKSTDIKAWMEERERLQEERDRIDEKLADVDKVLQAAQIIAAKKEPLPSAPLGIFGDEPGEAEEQETMVDAATRILREAGDWITHKEIKRQLVKIPHLRDRMKANPNYYYTMMGRISNRPDVEKEGKKYRYVGK